MKEDELRNWVDLRQDFRAMNVWQARLVDADDGLGMFYDKYKATNKSGYGQSEYSSSERQSKSSRRINAILSGEGTNKSNEKQKTGPFAIDSKFGGSNKFGQSEMKFSMMRKTRLPECGLSQPLSFEDANALDED